MFPVFLKIWLINITLAVLVVFFGMMSIDVWSKGDDTIPEIRTTKSPEKPPIEKRIMDRAMPPESTYGIVADKNLFSSKRVEFIPEKPKPGPPAISEMKIFLHGVILMGDRKRALISNPDPGPQGGNKPAKEKWVVVGDTMGDLRVTEIRKDRIILTQGANTQEILLYDKNKPARQITVAEKPTTPTVVTTAPTVVTTAPATATTAAAVPVPVAAAKPTSRIEEGKSASEAGYIIINTPFGPTKRKIE
jgi:hypothetical protein